MDETKLTADLPTMNVEIVHRATPDGRGEMVSIQLSATPDFRAALPLLGGMAQLPLMLAQPSPTASPLALWTQAAQAMMAPWLTLAGANPWLAMLQGAADPSRAPWIGHTPARGSKD